MKKRCFIALLLAALLLFAGCGMSFLPPASGPVDPNFKPHKEDVPQQDDQDELPSIIEDEADPQEPALPQPEPMALEANTEYTADFNGDGKDDIFRIATTDDPEYGDMGNMEFALKTQSSLGYTITLFEDVYFAEAWLVYLGNKPFLFASCDYASADYTTCVVHFDAEEDAPVIAQTFGSALFKSMEGDTVTMRAQIDVLGSYWADVAFTLEEDGYMQQLDDFIIDFSGREPLVTVKELPAELLLADGRYQPET
ncbi:MAG: hypothetical protein IJP03_05060, partial [Christensenellaceae bacterium]|nr:hypothetical protein [Christensenellaceae bacterium]